MNVAWRIVRVSDYLTRRTLTPDRVSNLLPRQSASMCVEFTVLNFLLHAALGNLIGDAGIFALFAHTQVNAELKKGQTVSDIYD